MSIEVKSSSVPALIVPQEPAPVAVQTATPSVTAGTSAIDRLQALMKQRQAGATTAPAGATATAASGLQSLRDEAKAIVKDKGLQAEAQKVADSVVFTDLMGIAKSGIEIQGEVAIIDKALLDSARNDKTGVVGETIRQINQKIASFDRTIQLPQAKPQGGWLSNLIKSGARSVEELKNAAIDVVTDYWQRYEPVGKQIEDLSQKLQDVAIDIVAHEAQVAVAQEASLASIDKFTVQATGLIMALERLETQVLPPMRAEAQSKPSDAALAQRVKQHEDARTTLDGRIRELFEQRTFAEQQVASAGMMRSAAVHGATRLDKVRENIVPLFYRLAFQEVVLFKQREGINLSQEITSGFDRMMKQSAQNLGMAYVAAAKAATEENIRAESLKETAQTLASALDEANAIAAAGRAANVTAEEKMQEARQILGGALVGADVPVGKN